MGRIGVPHTQETRDKISAANKGRVFTEEWKKNLSLAHKGQVSWRKGKKFVDEEISKAKRKAYIKEWKLNNTEKLKEQSKEWSKNNREKLAMLARRRYHNNKQKELDRIRLRKYGITGDEYRDIINQQEGKCPICNRSIDKNLSVDHDHDNGEIRGIICNKCNLAIGNADNSPERLRAMAKYLEDHNGTRT